MNKFNFYIFLTIFSLSLFAQDKEEIPIEEQRDNKIKALLEIVKKNKDIFVSEDRVRLEKFISLVDEREKLLNSAKNQLAQEIKRNEILEDTFQKNEKVLAELEESLQIKVGVLGELFGVTRQFAGELKSSSENDVTFSEFPERINTLNEIGSIKIHNKENFENLWIAYLSEIASGSEIKKINANITFPDGENQMGEIVRYGLFSATHNRKFLKPEPDLDSFLLLENQPESSILRSIRRHQNSDEYRSAAIDPTRGFLLSLYMDKAGWIERIAQGKSIGFIIILIGIFGLAFSVYKLRLLKQYEEETISESGDS